MTVLTSVPKITSVLFKGLDNLVLPFTSHALDPAVYGSTSESPLFAKVQADNDAKYYVKSVDGLNPPGRDIAIARTASGGKYQGATDEDREIVVLIGLNPDWDAGETPDLLRQNLYTMIYTGYDPKIDVQLIAGIFPICHEFGYVSKFEAAIFDANPVVQLTLTMLNPTFRALLATSYAKSELSETAPNVYNYGTAETGFQFAVKFTATRNGWFIKQQEDKSIGMVFDYTFHSGDLLTVSTIQGQRYVHVKPYRKQSKNMMGILTNDSEWVQLHPGNNHFIVPSKTSSWDWNGTNAFTFTAKYAGI